MSSREDKKREIQYWDKLMIDTYLKNYIQEKELILKTLDGKSHDWIKKSSVKHAFTSWSEFIEIVRKFEKATNEYLSMDIPITQQEIKQEVVLASPMEVKNISIPSGATPTQIRAIKLMKKRPNWSDEEIANYLRMNPNEVNLIRQGNASVIPKMEPIKLIPRENKQSDRQPTYTTHQLEMIMRRYKKNLKVILEKKGALPSVLGRYAGMYPTLTPEFREIYFQAKEDPSILSEPEESSSPSRTKQEGVDSSRSGGEKTDTPE